jgi:hypothetical protein
VSHLPERKEKNCLNCGANVEGRYCHICGQENIEPKEGFWHLVTHFMYDITHFDGKFFSTLQYLLFKPGYLSHEYLRGRRASYLHPIRMYVFTSAIFFLIFFSMHKEDEAVTVNESKATAAQVLKKLETRKKGLQDALRDSLPEPAKIPIQKSLALVESDIARVTKDTTAKDSLQSSGSSNFNLVSFSGKDTAYQSIADYDSVQKKLPAGERDNFLKRWIAHQNIHLKEKYHHDNKAIWTAILNKFKHLFPQMLFVSLPLFALLLKLVYIRRKNFFYVNHVVFTIHLYCATFIIILLGFLITELGKIWAGESSDWGSLFITFAGMFYWYKSLRNFYQQGRAKTLLKYFLLFILSCFMMIVLFTFFFIFSAMAI